MAAVFISFSTPDVALAQELVEFLRRNHLESAFLDRDDRTGLTPGVEWQGQLYREVRASEIMVVLWSANAAASRWCFFERTLANILGKRCLVLPLDGATLDAGLSLRTQALARLPVENRWARVLEGLEVLGIGTRTAFPWDRRRSPYPGLLSFDIADARVFFGRDTQVQRVLDVVRQVHRHEGGGAVLLVGPSGSGKSSVLRAGALARLRLEPESWLVPAPVRGSELTNGALESTLGSFFAESHPSVLGMGLEDLISKSQAAGTSRKAPTLVLSVDQVEELLDARQQQADVERWLRDFGTWTRDHGVIWLGTLRSEYLGDFQVLAGKAGFSFKTLPLDLFDAAELDQVILGPAQVAALEVEDELLRALLHDASVDALPLLAFTLRQLYERGDRQSLKMSVYEGLGKLERSVTTVADRVLQSHVLDAHLEERLDEVLLRLVRIDEEGHALRRPLPKLEIPSELSALFQDLIDNRLLVEREPAAAVEIAHEALMRLWPPLQSVVSRGQAFLAWHRRFTVVRSADPDSLLRGHALSEAATWLASHPRRLEEEERQFIRRSSAEDEAERSRKLHDAEELARTRSVSVRRARLIALVTLLLSSVAAILAVVALKSRDAARKAEDRAIEQKDQATAEARRLLASKLALGSDAAQEADGQLALLLALEAYKRDSSPPILRRLYAAAQPVMRLGGHAKRIESAEWSPNGEALITSARDRSLRLWSKSGQLQHSMDSTSQLRQPSFSPSGQFFAALTDEGNVFVWHDPSGQPTLLSPPQDALAFLWSPTADQLLVFSDAGFAVYAATGEALVPWVDATIDRGFLGLTPVGPFWSPDGRHIALTSNAGEVLVAEVASGGLLRRPFPRSPEGLQWLSAERIVLNGDKQTQIVDLSGAVVWERAAPGGCLLDRKGYASQFCTGEGRNRITLHDATGRSLRTLPASFLECSSLGSDLLCERGGRWFWNGVPVDYRLVPSRLSLWLNGGTAGFTKTGRLCLPRGRNCEPLGDVSEADLKDSDNAHSYAVSKDRALVVPPATSIALARIVDTLGSVSSLDTRCDTFQWLRDESFLCGDTRHALPSGTRSRLSGVVNPGGDMIAQFAATGQCELRDLQGNIVLAAEVERGDVQSIEWAPNGRAAVCTSGAQKYLLVVDSKLVRKLGAGLSAWSPRGGRIAFTSAAPESSETVFERDGAASLLVHPQGTGWEWSAGGRYLYQCDADNVHVLDDTGSSRQLKSPCPDAWSADDAWFITSTEGFLSSSTDNHVHDARDGSVIHGFAPGARMRWSPTAAELAIQYNSELVLWRPPNQVHSLARLPFPDFGAATGAFVWSPDGRHLAWTNGYRAVVIDVRAGTSVLVHLRGRNSEVRWSPDGARWCTVSDGQTSVWQLDGQLVAELAGGDPQWSSSGKHLALTLNDEQRIWEMVPADLAHSARRLIYRELTPTERERYGLK